MALSAALALPASRSSISTSNTFPCRTPATPAKPRAASAASIALPCGSKTPSFRRTVTRAFNSVYPCRLLDEDRAGALGAFLFHQDTEAPGNLLVRLDQAAHVAAEPVLVQLIL